MKANNTELPLKLAERLSATVNESFASGEMLEKVSPITAELLRYWFCEPFVNERTINFHEGQRQSILNVIYLHEVLKIGNVTDIYTAIVPDLMPLADLTLLAKAKYDFPKYAVKMATGTGKTWVMHALLLWQLLNARHADGVADNRFTQRFLIVAPGLVVYDRLLDAFKGRLKSGSGTERDPLTNDFRRSQLLFIPPAYRDEVFSFLQNNVVSKEDGIGRKVTGEGLIALTNWHLFMSGDDETSEDDDSASAVVRSLLPARPGTSAGNVLDSLDNAYLRGNELDYLASLPDLMVINDEAHHIHESKVAGEVEEVEWQKGLDTIANGKTSFFQIDFSATPYSTSGTGKNVKKHYFPHIVVDFDLATAMKKGLVKTLLLDKRQELTELEDLDYRAVRDEDNKVIGLSEGQRLMLRAGLTKLAMLERGFVQIDANKRPKMLVVCEDTSVSPFVSDFLESEGLGEEDILAIDSNKQGEVKPDEWQQIKEKLFNIDRYEKPKVIISVLMLREGFDVNNICVIVPLRASSASILLEQTIGRGLRLMWREPEYQEEKEENRRAVLVRKESPKSYLDMLSIVEHPAFQQFYEDLVKDGLAGVENDDLGGTNPVGDLIKVGLKEDYKDYDLFWPVVIRDAEEEMTPLQIDVARLEPFTMFSLEQLRKFLAKEGEVFLSESVLSETRFGKYEVTADLFNAVSYNEYLQKILRIVTKRDKRKVLPSIQINEAEIVRVIDQYIRTRLFGQSFNPFSGTDWKILLSKNGVVTTHIIKVMSIVIYEMQQSVMTGEVEVEKHWFSSIDTLRMRESYSLELQKVIYARLGYPSNRGKLEKEFMQFVDNDAEVERFLKINESQHGFAIIYYIRQDGLLATYHPDFIVATAQKVYLIETKASDQVEDKNVLQKRKAATEWVNKINTLPADDRMNREWEYVLLAENNFYMWRDNGATVVDMCDLSKVTSAVASGVLFA
ncbi:MAG: DEAD/DEAH box helicase family protein [Bacteroidales bacterium]|nr:DEAD/DEAH box helicase family protein [Bacteroidales bacterium]